MDTANFSQQLRVMPTLVKTLAEDHTHKFKLSSAGHLSVLRGARWSTAKKPLDFDAVQSLAEEIDARAEKAVLGPWFLCALRGADGLTIFGERRIDLPEEPLAEEVSEELLQLARAGSTGLIAGGVGSNKASMLLWLAAQLGRRELVFVSDIPPRNLLESTATHVFPPADDRERRNLERLLRAHDCIFWDRISRGDDLVSFTSTPGTHNRWFSIDADSPESLARRLRTVASSVGRLRLDSCMFIEVDVDTQSQITSLCRHEDGGWTELLSTGPALSKALGELNDVLSAPEPESTPRKKKDAARKRRPSPQAGIISPKRVGKSRSRDRDSDTGNLSDTGSLSGTGSYSSTGNLSGADKPPDEPTVNSNIEPLDEDALDEISASIQEELEEADADGLRGMSVAELAESAEMEEEELLRQSGEIDLQAFVAARNARRRQLEQAAASDPVLSDPVASEPDPVPSDSVASKQADAPPPGIGLQQDSDNAITNIADGAKVDAMLAQMDKAKARGEAPHFPDVDRDKLTPPVRDETTALTAVDMERIRESADDDLSWLLRDDELDRADKDDETLTDKKLPSEVREQNTRPSSPIWDADPAPTDELSREDVHDKRGEWSESEES